MMRQVREQALRAIEPSLNAHQRELLAQIRAGGGARAEVRRAAVVWVLRNNRPTPVRVEIGIADNGNTLLYSGLNEGDELIVGGGPRAQNAQQQRPGGGLMGGGRGMRVRGG